MTIPQVLRKLSVVVCTYNRADWLPAALSSLAEQTLDNDHYEVLVVDNNSTDTTKETATEYVNKYPNFRLLSEKKQGLSHARNLGWQSACGEFVAFMDDDARAEQDWGERIIAAFRNIQPRPVSVGGKILPLYDAPLPSWFSREIEVRSWGEEPCFLDEAKRRYGFSGSNMSFPRDVLERYGGFSTELGMQGSKLRLGEESYLYNRIQEQEPLFWYDPKLIVHHLVPRRNLTLRYRLARAYAAGRSTAFMIKEKSETNSLRVELLNTGCIARELALLFWRDRKNRSTQFLKLLEFTRQLGILTGRWSQ